MGILQVQQGHKGDQGIGASLYGEKLREPGVEKARGAFIHVDRYLVGEVMKV